MTKFTDAAVDRVAKAMHGQLGLGAGSWDIYRPMARTHLAAYRELAFMPMCEIVEPEPPKVDPDEALGRKILEAAKGEHVGAEGRLTEVFPDEFAKIGAAARKLLQP